jgi:DNA-directed RNA polymerase subunit RPC12/RpoP
MATQAFTCPNCGASLGSPGDDTTTIKCPYCNTSVIVPEELRTTHAPTFVVTSPRPASSNIGARGCIIAAAVLLVLFMAVLVFVLVRQAPESASQAQPAATQFPTATTFPTKIPTPTSPPPYAAPAVSFGQAGIGPGMLNDARYIAVDGSGTIYVADYQGGRIQAFDQTGKYLSQFKVGDPKTIIAGLEANHAGDVFVAYDTSIYRYKGATGEPLGELTNPVVGTFGDMAAEPDGSLAATWYEGRWGLITTLEGHRDDLVIFDPQGKISLTIPGFISGQTGDTALDNYITVDGLGNIFVLSDDLVYAFSPQGKYLNHFGNQGNNPGQLDSANSIAVDGQGQIYIGDSFKVHVFSTDGQFVTDFPAKPSVDAMVFDEKGALWVVSRDTVTQYVLKK